MKYLSIICWALVLYSTGPTSGHVINDRAGRAAAEGLSITFVNRYGKPVVEEQVILNDNSEARFDVMGRMAYVLDYEQNLLFFKELAEDKPCHVTNLNMNEAGIPYPEEIRALLSVSKFEMPADRLRMRLRKSNNQEVPDMLPLSEGVCRESEIIVFEPRPEPAPEVSKAVAKTTTEMPKSGVGWGELILIGIVIILLL